MFQYLIVNDMKYDYSFRAITLMSFLILLVLLGCGVRIIVDISACIIVDGMINPTVLAWLICSFPVSVKVYWLDINYLVLRINLRFDLTPKSIGNPKACKAKQDLVDQRGNTQ